MHLLFHYYQFLILCYLCLGSKMLALISFVLAINSPVIWAWDTDQMEVFDLVEEMNNINFYQFLDVPEVSIMVYFKYFVVRLIIIQFV